MITEKETNFVYFSGRLSQNHPYFFKELKSVLIRNRVRFGLLEGTNDIWCRDYMPIQVSRKDFVLFIYKPKYLLSKKDQTTITDAIKVCASIGIKPIISDIKLDGGNVVSSGTTLVMTKRIFLENPNYSKKALLKEIKDLLRVEEIIIIPEDHHDMFGHADGMVRFLDLGKYDNVILINDYSKNPKERSFRNKVYRPIRKEGFLMQPIPYNPYKNKKYLDATGVYINYLRIGKLILYPIFGFEEDARAKRFFTYHFGRNAVPIRSNSIAAKGGVLNCISWNIKSAS